MNKRINALLHVIFSVLFRLNIQPVLINRICDTEPNINSAYQLNYNSIVVWCSKWNHTNIGIKTMKKQKNRSTENCRRIFVLGIETISKKNKSEICIVIKANRRDNRRSIS